MFYDKYLKLCNEKGVKPTTAAISMGLTSAAVARWKTGSTPTDSTLLVIANFFGVSMADLLPDEEVARRELVKYPPDGMEDVAQEEMEKHPEYYGIKNIPADFSEDDKELFDLMRKYRDNPAIRIMFHEMDDADPAQALEIIDMIQKFKQGRR